HLISSFVSYITQAANFPIQPHPMALTAGTRIGPYTVTAPLGEGGMGIVFRAHDTKLQRDVALKLLPEHFADHADRLLRFQREAQVLASLNHPNIEIGRASCRERM